MSAPRWSIAVVALMGAACGDDVVVASDDGRDASEVHDAATWTLPDAVDSGRVDATPDGAETADGGPVATGAGIVYELGATTLSGPRGTVRVTWIVSDEPRLRWGF